MRFIKRGDVGSGVAEIRSTLVELGYLSTDPSTEPTRFSREGELSYFDEACDRALRAFQQKRGLVADGVVGPETWKALLAARYKLGDRVLSFSVRSPLSGDDVLAVQERLLEMGYDIGHADGIFGPRTHRAVQTFQRECGLVRDGVVGPETMRAFGRLARKVIGGQPQALRESALFDHSGPRFSGKRLVIDPAHGGDNPGFAVKDGNNLVVESEICHDLASRIQGRIVAMGGNAELTRNLTGNPTAAERARFANAMNADVFIALHCDHHNNPEANGLATYHFGVSSESSSTRGARLAGLVHREILARTHLTDCRTHPKTWELLRYTRMPAVHIELGYLTNGGDLSRLTSSRFRDTVAEAIVVAVQRVFLPVDAKVHTGALDFAALRELQV